MIHRNEQHGPSDAAQALAEVVADVTYKEGWTLRLAYMDRPTEHYAGSQGLTLIIHAVVPNSVKPGEVTYVEHWMAVPPTSWERDAWVRWVLDQIILVETHEAMEFYAVGGKKPYFPAHGPGRDPYEISLTDAEIDRRRGTTPELSECEVRSLLEAKAADPRGWTKTLPLCEYTALVKGQGDA